jgi:hypothetical protein
VKITKIFLSVVVFSYVTLGLLLALPLKGVATESVDAFMDARAVFISALDLDSKDITQFAPYRSKKEIGRISIGTDSRIVYGDGFYGESKGQIEKLRIGLSEVATLDIYCSSQAAASNGRDKVSIENIEVALGKDNQGPVGTGISCSGLQSGSAITSVGQPMGGEDNTLFMGITVDGKNKAPASKSALFDTNKYGAAAPAVRVLYH